MDQNVDLLSYKNCAGSEYKELLLKYAKDSFMNKNIEHSIFYQIKSLCSGFESRYGEITEETEFPETEITEEQERLFQDRPLFKYAIEYLKSRKVVKSSLKPKIRKSTFNNSIDSIQDVQDICSSLPQEWTIIQLCKEQREDTTYSIFQEIFAANAPIYLSILKHPRSKDYPKPICLRLTSDNQEELFKKFSILTKSFSEFSTVPPGSGQPKTTRELESYWAGMAVLESRIADAIAELKTFMGPWISLLCGNVKPPFKDKQHKIFKAVDKFCDSNDIECQEQRVLLSLLAQQRHLLTDEHIKQASTAVVAMMAGDGDEGADGEEENLTTSRVIYEFLMKLPSEDGIAFGPCILILDERIDHFYWEVLNPWQELCRISSFHILVGLYERYKSKIKKGYLMADVENGRCVINPDSNLPNMEERMKNFFNYWLPNWKCTYNIVPKMEDYRKLFDEADCYVYCGHGSGLQYLNGRKISKFQMKCIVFLFGCDSVRLRSPGLHGEMVASHLFYHAALCPAVVGTLQLGFDFQVDKIATNLLSEWIPSNNQDIVHWHNIDKACWKKGTIQSIQSKNTRILMDNYEGSLAKAVSAIHQKTEEKLYKTVGFVYRGLPVWNASEKVR
ncbi:separin homolog sep-1 isoform X2 [Episyrphus balteatus]|uniref:separin homolog sep-1 isoform X2 n=1 Tax=Episyrphus balteatus TaxID=286459 RepID=UPI0024866DA5|nr:separin homolog sep-1 isoform X2 [Episyrphus balteatus]